MRIGTQGSLSFPHACAHGDMHGVESSFGSSREIWVAIRDSDFVHDRELSREIIKSLRCECKRIIVHERHVKVLRYTQVVVTREVEQIGQSCLSQLGRTVWNELLGYANTGNSSSGNSMLEIGELECEAFRPRCQNPEKQSKLMPNPHTGNPTQ